MSNWNQLYDLEPLLHTPPTEPTSKQHSHITCKPFKRYDSDISSISSSGGADDFDSPIWWDILDHEEEAIARYRKFLHEQLVKGRSLEKHEGSQIKMTMVEAQSKPASNAKTVSLPKRRKEKSDHMHIVEKMRDSRDLSGWILNGISNLLAGKNHMR